jgi:hypothetical protein
VGAGGVILRTTTGGSGSSVTRVGPESAASAFGLRQNYPNPFNPTTVIDYTLPEEASVSVETYNALGQRISSLVERVQPAGPHTATFNATGLPSGVYFYRLTAHPLSGNRKGAFTDTRRMILAR